jgi:hypothetical protein
MVNKMIYAIKIEKNVLNKFNVFLISTDIALIHGPPGTGKTTTLVFIEPQNKIKIKFFKRLNLFVNVFCGAKRLNFFYY